MGWVGATRDRRRRCSPLAVVITIARVAAAAAVVVRVARAARPHPSVEAAVAAASVSVVVPARDEAAVAAASVSVGGGAITVVVPPRDEATVAAASVSVGVGAITVVVPARDEAARITRCLAPLRGAPGVAEVIVVDDESTDATAAVAASFGARVITGAPLPEGWVGKPWALQQGLDAAATAWVVTFDADTEPSPELPAALVARAERDGWDLLTAGGRFVCDDPLQQALHPSMLTTLVYRFGPVGARHRPKPERTLANGQCTAVRRRQLVAAGGYAAAARHLTDDVALARHLASRGWRVGFLDAAALLDVRMYDSARDAWRGWGRSLPMPDVTAPAAQVADLAVVWLAQALPLVRLVTGRGDALDVTLLAVRIGTLVGTRRAYRAPGLTYWLSPLLDLPVAARLTAGAVRPSRSWRGRTYAGAATTPLARSAGTSVTIDAAGPAGRPLERPSAL